MTVTRRDVLTMTALTAVGSAIPSVARAQAPKRGGTLTFRGWDPPLFDPMLTATYRVQIPATFTHSRLVKHRAGPAVVPDTFAIEPDLAESWTQPNETTRCRGAGCQEHAWHATRDHGLIGGLWFS